MNKKPFLFLIIILISMTVQARLVELDGSAIEKSNSVNYKQSNSSSSGWEQLKAKVSNIWNKWRQSDANESNRNREPAQVDLSQYAQTKSDVSGQAEDENKKSEIVKSNLAQLPTYNTQGARQSVQQKTSNDLDSIKQQPVIATSKPGRSADGSLPKNKSGVVTFSLTKTKESKLKDGKISKKQIPIDIIPKLDIGEEPTITRNDWKLQEFDFKLDEFQSPKPLFSPEVVAENEIKKSLGPSIEMVTNAKDMKVSVFGPDDKVSFESVRKITMLIKGEMPIDLKEIKLLSAEEIKMLKAEILLSKGDKCHLATGILSDLVEAQNPEIKSEANFQMALCLHQMGLFTESIKRMKEVIKFDQPEKLKLALKILVADLPKEFEEEIASELKKIKDINLVPEESRDAFHYIIAKASARQGHYNQALEHADLVSKKSKKYAQAQYIMAIAEYVLEKKKQSFERQRRLKEYIDQNKGDKDLRTLISLNLARMAFQEKEYKDALINYGEIKKDHPLWVDALIEQGWAQLQMQDYSGAIGNMYSIHSPYFRSVYQPESFVVRTIGYLNICQFGDAYRTLSQLDNMHRNWLTQIKSYRKDAKALKHYESLVKYLKSASSQTNIDGLPFQVLREIGRHRDFLNIQEAINARIDEGDQYFHINGVINKEKDNMKWLIKKSKERLAELSLKLKQAEKNAELAKNINPWKQQKKNEEAVLATLQFKLEVYEDSHKSFTKFKSIAERRLKDKKQELQLAAGEVLRDRLKRIEQKLVSILDNNELLRYEVFAGSGENIRFHAAGGVAKGDQPNRIHYSVKPESKSLQWNFDGEFWEDEIGNYRSSLKDNCPQRAAMRN